MEPLTQQLDAPPAAHPRRPWLKWSAGVAAAVVLFGAGAWAGSAGTDPTTSEQYVALQNELSGTVEERDATQGRLEEIAADYDALSGKIEAREQAAAEKEAEADERSGALDETAAALGEREQAVGKAEKEKAANSVSDGTWTVGLDIAAGTYRIDEAVDSDCYWAVLRTGSNGDIIENDIPGGGRPSVTLSKGQDFNSTRCGSWTKQ